MLFMNNIIANSAARQRYNKNLKFLIPRRGWCSGVDM